jgi:aspartokinase
MAQGTPQNHPFNLLSDVIEKVIDAEVASTTALSALKGTVDQLIELARQNAENIRVVEEHFKNGFKSEIKNHVSQVVEEHDNHEACRDFITNKLQETQENILASIQEHQDFAEDMLVAMTRIRDENANFITQLKERIDELKAEIEKFHTFGFWAKIIIGAIIGIGSISALVLKLHTSIVH